MTTAVSASLFLNGMAALSAAITYFRKKMVDVKTAFPLLLTSTLAAPFGAMLTNVINIRVFSGILALVILLAAIRMIFSAKTEAGATETGVKGRILGGGAIGIGVGFMAGLLGIGGGVFIVPLLIYILHRYPVSSIPCVADQQLDGFIAVPSIPLEAIGDFRELIHMKGIRVCVELDGPQAFVFFIGGRRQEHTSVVFTHNLGCVDMDMVGPENRLGVLDAKRAQSSDFIE